MLRKTLLAAWAVALAVALAAGAPVPATAHPASSVTAGQPPAHPSTSRSVPDHFVGLSIEWSLVERYMGPTARPAFIRLLANMGRGVLRIGGSSQDVMPFEADSPNTDEIITPEDLRDIRDTLDALDRGGATGGPPRWGVVLGTAMSPPSDKYPFRTTQNAHQFVTQGVDAVFTGSSAREVVGIELGNEPDLSYGSDLASYLDDLRTYSADDVTGPWPVIAPNTSEDILPWTTVASGPTRYFHDWPQILDTVGSTARRRAGAFGAYASDHFYPLARTCTNKPYRCPTVDALLSDEHLDSLRYQVYTHARQAAADGLGYRLEETNTAAGRGADGVSNVAGSATYALIAMFDAACPQPPDGSGANRHCGVGAVGVNFHDAEVNSFFAPQEGNAYYNAIDYDPSSAIGSPTAAPLYYALLLFGRFVDGGMRLRPVARDSSVVQWTVDGPHGTHRLFLINRSRGAVTTSVAVRGRAALVDRMTPDDPTGAGRTLDAPAVRIDGRQVSAGGAWPGFAPRVVRADRGRLTLTVAPGEAAVLTTEN